MYISYIYIYIYIYIHIFIYVCRPHCARCGGGMRATDGRIIRCLCYDGFSGVDCAVSSFSAALLRPFSALQVGEYPEYPCVRVLTVRVP
jgi:hypothetical protein